MYGQPSVRLETRLSPIFRKKYKLFIKRLCHLANPKNFGVLYITYWIQVQSLFKPIQHRLTIILVPSLSVYLDLFRQDLLQGSLQHLVDSLPNCTSSDGFQLRPVTYNEVIKQLEMLRLDSCTGADHLPAKYIKIVSEYITSPLTHIFNRCIAINSFPKVWKLARVSPIPTVDHPTDFNHYRPIVILPALSKILERLVLE